MLDLLVQLTSTQYAPSLPLPPLLQLVVGRGFSLAVGPYFSGEDSWRSPSTTSECSLARESGKGDDDFVANATTFIADTASIILQPLRPTSPAPEKEALIRANQTYLSTPPQQQGYESDDGGAARRRQRQWQWRRRGLVASGQR
ncbi:hypothetical protein O988_08306 [Pseudogymnoascus sp. VKM F-3808]|nr:hypothetical protein O988_08306 [Pseudogymnoascus sp. VKM F-3808]